MSLILALLACGEPAVEAPVVDGGSVTGSIPVPGTAATSASAQGGDWALSGEGFQVPDVTPAAPVLAAPATFAGKTLRVEGRLAEVCQKKGCWVVMTDDAGHSLRVTMKDHAFGVATDSVGKTAQVEGTLVAKATDAETQAHYASEGSTGVPTADGYELIATGVAVLN